ncbi:hypothetical protein A6R68_13614, partial [Neotoma lepida]
MMRGSVCIGKNNELCYLATIDWSQILDSVEDNYIVLNIKSVGMSVQALPRTRPTAQPLSSMDSLWNGAGHTVIVKRFARPSVSHMAARLECLGGCSEPSDPTKYVTCHNFYLDSRYVETCPPPYYHFWDWSCVNFSFCQDLYCRCRGSGRPGCHWCVIRSSGIYCDLHDVKYLHGYSLPTGSARQLDLAPTSIGTPLLCCSPRQPASRNNLRKEGGSEYRNEKENDGIPDPAEKSGSVFSLASETMSDPETAGEGKS